MNTEAVRDFLQSLPFWDSLSPDIRKRLLEQTREISYEPGASVATADDCLGVLAVRRGTLRVYLLSEDGQEATISLLYPGDVCVLSASCLISAITFDVQIDAETACEAILLPSHLLSGLMQENIHVQNYIYRLTTEHFSRVITAMERFFFFSLKQRIAAFLIDESARRKTDLLYFTQEQLARSIGSAREAVSRTLRQMAREGSLEVLRGGIRIQNKSLLYQTVSSGK